jgi:hypothetical protein
VNATDWYFLGMVAAFCVAMVGLFLLLVGRDLADAIRAHLNDRRDARDVKRGVGIRPAAPPLAPRWAALLDDEEGKAP